MVNKKIYEIFDGKYSVIIATIFAIVVAYISYNTIGYNVEYKRCSILFIDPAQWIPVPILSWACNVAALLICGYLMTLLNKIYAFIHLNNGLLFISYCVFSFLAPMAPVWLTSGAILSIVVVGSLFLLYGSYQRQNASQSSFMIMFALTMCGLFQYAFLLYIPLFMIGFIQMRTGLLRVLIAGILGVIAPLWILLGMGICDVSMFQVPDLRFNFDLELISQNIPATVAISFTVLLGLMFGIYNLLRSYSAKLQIRAYNGFIIILSIFTTIFMALDMTNAVAYLPLLYITVAVQMSLFSANTSRKISFYVLLTIICIYSALYMWNIYY